MGTLYIVATPIGNLQDLSFRAVEILTSVEIIACEDTRHTGLLLKYIKDKYLTIIDDSEANLKTPLSFPRKRESRFPIRSGMTVNEGFEVNAARPTLLSYYEQNELRRIPQILNALFNGVDVVLVSDAGTPTISDPGFKLVRECIAQGIRVESIPGPSSVISALVVSGLPTDKFLFLGYLPKKPGKRKNIFNELKCLPAGKAGFKDLKQIHPTIIFFESPHRIIETLEQMHEVFGDIDTVICRELTKIHEEIRRSKISQSLDHFSKVVPKGELVVLFRTI